MTIFENERQGKKFTNFLPFKKINHTNIMTNYEDGAPSGALYQFSTF